MLSGDADMKKSLKHVTVIGALLTATALPTQAAQDTNGTSWIDKGFPFDPDMSSTEQAQQWALCSATLETFSDQLSRYTDQTATAELIGQTANGAAVAIIGTYIVGLARDMDNMDVDNFSDAFKKAVEYGQFASTEFVDKAQVLVRAKREGTASDQAWMENLAASAMTCMQPSVLELQEMLINTARETVLGVPK
jgi:hypothetical protein